MPISEAQTRFWARARMAVPILVLVMTRLSEIIMATAVM